MNKMGRLIVIIAGITWFIAACDCGHLNQASEKENDTHSESVDEDSSMPNNGLVLDNGKKWLANQETTNGIKNMQEIVGNYAKDDNITAEQLSDELQQELNGIFNKCNIEGEAHEQLHNYLVPLISKLESVKSQEFSDDQLKEIQTHLRMYFNYFK